MSPGPAAALAVAAAALLAAPHAVLLPASRRLTSGAVPPDALVLVPGHRLRPDGRITAVGAWRCRIAVRSAGPGSRFLVAGGLPVRGRTEADALADALVRLGVDPARIDRERTSRTTRGNAAANLDRLRAAPAVVVASQPFHGLRLRRAIAGAAPELVSRLRPARDAVLRESLALGWWQLLHEARRRAHRRRGRIARCDPTTSGLPRPRRCSPRGRSPRST